MPKLKALSEIKNLKNKIVLLRVDFNVPFKNGKIADDSRIKATLPTIKYLLAKQAKILVLTHLGRPDGKVVPELSTKPLAVCLGNLLKQKVAHFSEFPIAGKLKQIFNQNLIKVAMMENLRFSPLEDKNDIGFAKKLAGLGEIYIDEAFAFCHRPTASMVNITKFLPGYAGLQLQKEVENLSQVLESKLYPRVAIIGGAKLETKVKVIKNLIKKMDYILVGGAIANNFIKAKGHEIGLSKIDEKEIKTAADLLSDKIIMPVDVAVAANVSGKGQSKIRNISQVGKNEMILDLGPQSVLAYVKIIKSAKLVVWNGPLGYFEIAKYKKASQRIAQAIAQTNCFSVVGGGETGQLIDQLKLTKKFSFVSTGGGAMLEFLEGKILPGIKPLLK